MNISIEVSNVQHINEMKVDLDFENNDIVCIVSKNGVGKTTLLKSLGIMQNIAIIQQTSSNFTLREDSSVKIAYGNSTYQFDYSTATNNLDIKAVVREGGAMVVELPIPFGKRYSSFSTISKIDSELKEKIITGDYGRPDGIIEFLCRIYKSDKFNSLKSCVIQGVEYYFTLVGERYVREDYFSSGEYFLISLYRLLHSKDKQFIAIDEIDISLDAAAQVHLIEELVRLCKAGGKKILFTTHSLALMKTLDDLQVPIMFLEEVGGVVEASRRSYNFINGVMFGFKGFDKYILTEDVQLERYIKRILSDVNSINSYKVLHIGGCDAVVSLMARNRHDAFFASDRNVISVLDKDVEKKMANKSKENRDKIIYLPFDSIEKELHAKYKDKSNNLPYVDKNTKDHKKIFEKLERQLGYDKIIGIVEKGHRRDVEQFKQKLKAFVMS